MSADRPLQTPLASLRRRPAGLLVASALILGGCAVAPAQAPGKGHLQQAPEARKASGIPAPVLASPVLTPPKPAARTETYSVSVRNIPAQDLLFALARDAKLNIDLHPGIEGGVTINAIDQTLPQILTRIAKQVDMRWEIDGPNLVVLPDTPFLRNYRIDYVNMARDVKVTTEVNSQVSSGGVAGSTQTGGAGATTRIESASKNAFWATMEKNIKDMLRETDKILPEGSSETTVESSESSQTKSNAGNVANELTQALGNNRNVRANVVANDGASARDAATTVRRVTFREAASVIVNPESGVVAVRATSRQHEKIQEYIDMVTSNARRQVMIEATIVEVTLSNGYEQGINWQSLRSLRRGLNTAGFSLAQGAVNSTQAAVDALPDISTSKSFLLNYVAPGLGISSTIELLETFGNVKVLSSPKISVLNNQTAVIKVVDNVVYFTVKADTTTSSSGTGQTTVTTTPNSVAVGLVMSVTPQISDGSSVLLNVRPTISRLKGEGKRDPNPNIPDTIPNIVPEIQTREMESMLRLTDGEIAVMGGLMSDELSNTTNAVPGLNKLPLFGNLFTQRNDVNSKTELVIFIKPTIIRDPSLEGDYASFGKHLPGQNFFAGNPGPAQQVIGRGAP